MTTLADVVEARERAAEASTRLRATVLAALDAGHPLRQVAIAADVNRQTIYNWRGTAALTATRRKP